MTRTNRESRHKAAGAIPKNNGVGGEDNVRREGGEKRKRHGGASEVADSELVGKSDPEKESKGKAEMKKIKKKEKSGEEVSEKESGGDDGKGTMKGNKDGEVRKGGKEVGRRADGDGGGGKLEDVASKKKKKKKIGGTGDEKAEQEKKEVGGKVAGGEINGREVITKKDESAKMSKETRGSTNVAEDRSKVIASSSEALRFEEDELRKSSKKQRERKDKDVEKNEGDADDTEKKPGEESGLLKIQKQRNVDENADDKLKNDCKSSGTVVLSLSRSTPKSRGDSPTKKNKEKAEGKEKKPRQQKSQSKKRKASEGEIKDVMVRTSGAEKETKEGVNKAEDGKRDGRSEVKKKTTNGEKADEKDSKSCSLPLNRVRTIIRNYNSIPKVSQETSFLICKATECFIEQFCEDAFELAASHGQKKSLKYEHLSSLVFNMDRYDFLSDYVPQKIKAKNAVVEAKALESR